MTGRNDRPGSGPVDRPGQGGSPRTPQEELRRRLANLPANHPSSPWYRERPPRRERPGKGRDAPGDGEPAGAGQGGGAEPGDRGPAAVGLGRSGESRFDGRGRPADARRGPVPEIADPAAGRERAPGAGGEAAAAVARAARGASREQSRPDRRRGDDALWQRAASLQAAGEARKRARGAGQPVAPRPRRDPYRPWFADKSGRDPWLSAEGGGDPWFI
jgi:hypothetical protein